jgi:sigma-B regulation protein RsbU (phosphoserine phosphatase)
MQEISPVIGSENAPLQTLLLVDDSSVNLGLLKESLDGLGYRLLEASDGQHALELARAELPDLILLDILMPGMDGFEVCLQLRQEKSTAEIPVIFLSALDELEDKVRGLELGAVDYISKPFRLQEVIARVNTHLTIDQLKRKVQKQRDELERELQQVAETQRSLLLKDLPEVAGLRLAVCYETSRYAGGDLFDVLSLGGNRWGILVADAEGHSTPAAVLMAMCCALMRSCPDNVGDPAAVLNYLNSGLCRVSSSRLVTALYTVYDAERRQLSLARAGHPSPLLFRPSTGLATEIPCEGIYPLGLIPYVEGAVPVLEFSLQSGDQLLFYTDGLIERFNPQEEIYGVERLKGIFAAAGSASPQEILREIHADATDFAAGRPADDDQTLLLAIVD